MPSSLSPPKPHKWLARVVHTSVSLSIAISPLIASAQTYTYKAYVKDLMATGATTPITQNQTGTLAITPSSYDFGNTPVNTTSEAVFTVKNTSTTTSGAIVTLGQPTLSNAVYSYESGCPSILAPQGACEVRVRFKPTSASTSTSTFTFPAANAKAPLPSASLTGQGEVSALSLSPNPVVITTDVGTTSPTQTVVATNTGNTTLQIASISTTAPFVASTPASGACGSTLSPQASCSINVQYSPTTVGTHSASLAVNTPTTAFTTTLAGTAAGPSISTSPSSITDSALLDTTTTTTATNSLAPQSVKGVLTSADPLLNRSKLVKTVQITNSGSKTLNDLDVVYLSNTTHTPYVSSDTCTSTLAPGASCSVSIIAYKHELKTFGGNVKVTGQYIDPVLIPVSLSIVGTAPTNSLTSDSPSHAFGQVPVNTPSPAKRITFTYIGNSTATLTIPSSTSLINVSNDTCTSTTLQPGDTCSVDLKITPSTPNTSIRSISWTPSYAFSTNPPSPLPHQLTYQGLGETLALVPSAINFPLSTTSSQSAGTYTLYNTGNLPTTISSSHQTTNTSWSPSFNTSACTTLQPGTSCPITALASSTQQGTYTGTLTFTGTTSTLTAPTSLTVSDAPNLTLSSRSINFGNVIEGSLISPQSVLVSNIGGAPALLGTLTTTAPFQLNHNCPESLNALATCTLSFSVDTSATPPPTPTITDTVNLAATQPYNTNITLAAAYFGSEKNQLLNLSITPSSATFPFTPPGQTSIPKSFTVHNDGETPQLLSFNTLGDNGSEYTVDGSTCATEIAPFDSCVINVSYTPSRALSIPQNTIVAGNSDGTPAVTAILIASDIPVNALTFNPLKFDPTNPATGNNIQNFYYKNTSANPLTITPQFQIGNKFLVHANTCSSVPSGDTCKITVQAKTAQEGSFQDVMLVNSTPVSLSATVNSYPSLTFTQANNIITQLNYGTVSHKKPQPTSTVQLNNYSSSTAELKPTTFSSTSGISQLNNCGPILAYGNPCDFQINVVPTTTKNPLNIDSYAWSSVLRVSTKDGQVTSALPIKGTSLVGTHSLPTAINFGTVYMGQTLTKPLPITNASTNQAEISPTSLSTGASDISHSTPCLGTWIAPGQSCDSTLSFTPTAQGIRAGTINVGVVSKSSTRRTIPWTATVLSGFTTEGLFTPNTWSPVTPVGTPLVQLITATNTYYQPLSFSATWTKSNGFPDPLTVQNDNCAGKTIQPQATCTFELLLSSPNTYEKKTASTLTTTISPLAQTASISIPTVHVTPGDPTITSLTSGTYPTGYTVPNTTVKINGTGFGTNLANTIVYVNDVALSPTAIIAGEPFAGWKITYSTSGLINLFVPSSAPQAAYTIRVHNYGSPNDPSAILNVASPAAATYNISASVPSDPDAVVASSTTTNTSSGALPFNTNTRYFISPVGTPTEYTYTFTNTGGMPYIYSSATPPTPNLAVAPNTTLLSNSCTGTTLPPLSSCVIVISVNPTTAAGANVLLSIPTSFGGLTRFYHHATAIVLDVFATSALPTNGGAAPLVSADTPPLVDFRESPVGVEQLVTYTLKNNSSLAVSLTPTFSTTGSSYSVKSDTCSAPVTKGATCTVTVSYNPSNPTGTSDPGSLLVSYGYGKTLSIPLTGTPIPAYSSAGISLQGLAFYAPLALTTPQNFVDADNNTPIDTAFSVNGPLTLRQFAYGDVGNYTYSGDTSYTFSRNTFNISVPWRYNFKSTSASANILKAMVYSSDAKAPITDATQWTFGTWLSSMTSSGALYSQIGNPNDNAGATFYIALNSSRQLCYIEGLTNALSSSATICSTTQLPSNTAWHFVTLSKSGNTLSYSLNGATPVVIGTITSTRTSYNPNQFVSIGGYSTKFDATTLVPPTNVYGVTLSNASNVGMTDMFLYSRILTPSEIQQIASRRAPLQPR